MDETRRSLLGGLAGAGTLALVGDARRALAQDKPEAAPAGTISNEAIKKEKAAAMQYHSERPITGSVPEHEHDFDVTPSDRMFVRNNLLTPDVNAAQHRLAVGGLVDKELAFTLDQLRSAFPVVTLQGMLECAGSGRTNFNPRPGAPWS